MLNNQPPEPHNAARGLEEWFCSPPHKSRGKVLYPVPRNSIFDDEELRNATQCANHGDLNIWTLHKAAEKVFGGETSISPEKYRKIVEGNYDDYDLERHGSVHFLTDLRLLAKTFQIGINVVRQTTSDRSKQVLFMGCGPGRLAIPSIELAKKEGIKRIVFNDLLEHHIEKTRQKIIDFYNTSTCNIDGVQVDFLVGDFIEKGEELIQNINERFDAIFSNWFVTTEIADFSDKDRLQKSRRVLYKTILDLLTKQGVFIEDIPYSEGVGTYYYLGRLKTYAILDQMRALQGINDQLLISNFSHVQEGGFPYHLRYVPANGKHRTEMENAGFIEHLTAVDTIPNGFKSGRMSRYNKEAEVSNIQKLIQRAPYNTFMAQIRAFEFDLLHVPSPLEDPMAKQKKTTIWRKKMRNGAG